MDRPSWKPKIFKATEAVDYKANEATQCLSCRGEGEVDCYDCRGTGTNECPRCYGDPQGCEACNGGERGCDICRGTGKNECSRCNGFGTIKSDGTLYGESKSNETQYGTLNPDGSVTNKMDLDDSNSDDPIAYNFGFFEGKSGEPMDDYDDLAPEYVRGYNDGKKSIGESVKPKCGSQDESRCDECNSTDDCEDSCPCRCLDNYVSDWMKINESKANEDDHKKSWGELDSIAKMGFSDIGYDQQSWDSEPEEIRAEMETVVKDNLGENWKEVANKFYKEELNKGKKSGGESKANEADPCWKGYKQIGMKDKDGKQVPNCVPNASEFALPSMFTRKKSNFQNPSFKSYAKVFEEPIESKWERIKYSLGVDFYEFFRLEWNNIPSEIQDIFRATVSVESKADEFSDWGSWSEDQSKMSQRDQISIMKDRGIDDKTLVKMGLKYFLDDHNSQKNGIEGFIDRIEKELGKFGINLDKPEEQEQED